MKVLFVFDRPLDNIRGGAEVRALNHIAYLEDRQINYDLFLIDRYNNYTQLNQEALSYLAKTKVDRIFVHRISGRSLDGFYRKAISGFSLLFGIMPDVSSPIHALPNMIQAFQKVVRANSYDLIFFNHIYVSSPLLKYAPIKCNTKTIIDTHDIYANLIRDIAELRKTKVINRILQKENSISKKIGSWLFNNFACARFNQSKYERTLKKEISYLEKFDNIITISPEEYNLFYQEDKLKHKLSFIPAISTPNTTVLNHINKNSDNTFKLLFIGSQYDPNVHGLKVFCDRVVPLLNSQIELIVVGGVSLVSGLTAHPQVKLLGFVEDVSYLYLSVDAVVLPLFYGSGVSIKAVEALSYGKPIIATPKGVRGLSVRHQHEVLIAENLEEFPNLIESLRLNPKLRQILSINAVEYIKREHSRELVYQKMDEIILT
jgi:glycosyltransferase involved in cell wall biosynthesis